MLREAALEKAETHTKKKKKKKERKKRKENFPVAFSAMQRSHRARMP